MALTDNLVAHYLLNNNTDDCHGSYDAVAYFGATFKGDVANFDDTSTNMIQTPVIALGHTYTLSFWVKFNTIGTYSTPLGSSAEDKHLTVTVYSAGDIKLYVGNGSDWGTLVGSATGLITTDTLYNIQIVVDNKSANIYINNGSSVASGTLTYDLGTEVLNFGTRYSGALAEHYIDGVMSNVRVYTDAKDATARTEIYDEGYYPKPLTAPTTTNLIAHYPLTGTAEDIVGGYDGVETNGMGYYLSGVRGSIGYPDGDNDYIEL